MEMIHTYVTDYGTVEVTEAEAALLMAEDWITQRPLSAGNLAWIMPAAKALRRKCEEKAKGLAPRYFWLGADAEAHHG